MEPIPIGIMYGWEKAIENIPPGWFLCDGTNGTPDLSNLNYDITHIIYLGT